jgi:small-conductance mechanosensitive channel
MTNLIRFLSGIFLIFCLLFFAPFESAAQTSELNSDPQRQIEIWQAQADEIEKDLQAILSSDKQAEPNQMGLYIEPLKQHIREADELIGIQNSFITPLQDQLNALGEKPADDQQEEPRIARERERITQEIQKYQSLQKQADVYKTRAFKMLETINRIEREAFAQKLIYRSVSITDPDVFKNAYNALLSFDINLETLKTAEHTPYYLVILCIVLISYLIAWNVRRHLLKLINQRYSDAGLITHAQRLKYMLSLAALRAFPFFFAIGLLYGTFTYLEQTDDLWFRTTLIGIIVTATMYILAYLYFAPYARPLRISLLDDIPAIKTARHFAVLGTIIGLDIIVVGFLWAHTATQDNQALLLCVATVFRILEATALWRFTRTVKRGLYGKKPALISTASDYIRDDKHSIYHTVVRIGIKISVLVSLITPFLVMAGYIKLSQFILFRSVGTGITLAIGFAFYKIIREFLTVIKGKPLSEEKTRQQAENSIQLVSVLVSAILLMLAVPVMSLLWGGSIEDISLGWTALLNGFSIAGTRFSPADIFTFFIIFFIGYVITRIIQNLLKRSVLPYTRLDVGASNSIVSGIGYFGVILALGQNSYFRSFRYKSFFDLRLN